MATRQSFSLFITVAMCVETKAVEGSKKVEDVDILTLPHSAEGTTGHGLAPTRMYEKEFKSQIPFRQRNK